MQKDSCLTYPKVGKPLCQCPGFVGDEDVCEEKSLPSPFVIQQLLRGFDSRYSWS